MSELMQLFLLTADLARSRAFFEDGLALEPRRIGETSVTYETGACELKLQSDFPPETLEAFNLDPPEEPRGEGAVYVIELSDPLDVVHERIASLSDDVGVALTEPREVPWGHRMLLTSDPNGFVFEVRSSAEAEN